MSGKLVHTDLLITLRSRWLLVRVRNLVKLLISTLLHLSLWLLVREESSRLSSHGGWRGAHTRLCLAFGGGQRCRVDTLVALVHTLRLSGVGSGLIVLHLSPLLHLILIEHLNEVNVLLIIIEFSQLIIVGFSRRWVLHRVELSVLSTVRVVSHLVGHCLRFEEELIQIVFTVVTD